jgi:hypothetical protein
MNMKDAAKPIAKTVKIEFPTPQVSPFYQLSAKQNAKTLNQAIWEQSYFDFRE